MAKQAVAPYDDDIISGEVTWDAACVCGHTREEHFAATGALGSFGGSACECCWTCGCFRYAAVPAHPEERPPAAGLP